MKSATTTTKTNGA